MLIEPHPRSPWHDLTAADWQALAAEHGTPYYLFDADTVARRVAAVRDAFEGQASVYYAVKCNPNLGLLRALLPAVDGLDISSGGELAQALLAGHPAQRMSFAGPAKTESELDAAIRAGVGGISVESLSEIDVCARVAARLRMRSNILLRVNPLLPNRAYGVKMGGRPVQFGIDEEDLPRAEARLLALAEHLDFRGVHAYVGSQCFDPAAVAEATKNALRIALELEQRTELRCAKINLGGGFGVAHGKDAKELDLAALAELLAPRLEAHRAARPGCELIFELGRYLTAPAGIYVTRAISRKMSRGKVFIGCDGGLNHHLAAAGTFGAALRGNFPLSNLTHPDAPVVTCNIAGPSCNPTDLLGVEVTLPDVAEHDLIGVAMSGSYGLTASPLLFLGRDSPVELVRSAGRIAVGRSRHSITDFN